jgi:hypothetical protein
MQPRVTAVKALPGNRLALTFDDGTDGVVDCTPWLYERDTGLYAPLRDPALFGQVYVNQEFGIIEWPNGADVDPYVLYEMAHPGVSK